MSERCRLPATDAEMPCHEAEELARYARVVRCGVWLVLALILSSFLLDLTGLTPRAVDRQLVVQHWHRPHDEFNAATRSPVGWQCLGQLRCPDMVTLSSIGLLGMLTPLALLSILPLVIKKRDWVFAAVIVAQVLVLLLAAAGCLDVR